MTVNASNEGEVDFEGQLTVPSPPSLRRAPVLPLHLSRCSDADFCGYFFLHVRVLFKERTLHDCPFAAGCVASFMVLSAEGSLRDLLVEPMSQTTRGSLHPVLFFGRQPLYTSLQPGSLPPSGKWHPSQHPFSSAQWAWFFCPLQHTHTHTHIFPLIVDSSGQGL